MCPQVLFMAGWQRRGDTLSLAADAPLGPLQAAAARLRRLADRKGHSGEAVSVKPSGEDGRPPSQYYGQPGFRYQEQARRGPSKQGRRKQHRRTQVWHGRLHGVPSLPPFPVSQIYHCSACDRPINDGSERLWTRRHDAPPGEYRQGPAALDALRRGAACCTLSAWCLSAAPASLSLRPPLPAALEQVRVLDLPRKRRHLQPVPGEPWGGVWGAGQDPPWRWVLVPALHAGPITACRMPCCSAHPLQGCWDVFQVQQQQQQQQQQQHAAVAAAGHSASGGGATGSQPLHAPSHAFQHIGPRMSRHNDYYGHGGSGDGPWGNRPAAPGYGRALQRLSERYGGIRFA